MTPFHSDPNKALAELNENLARVSSLLYARRLSNLNTQSCGKNPAVPAGPHEGGGRSLPPDYAVSAAISKD